MNIRRSLPVVIGSLAVAVALGLAGWRQSHPAWARYQPGGAVRTLVPTISNKPELCLTCHEGIEEISSSHPVDVFGCVSCHGGDGLALDETKAHTGLLGPRGNPADLSVVEQTCGTANCHGGDLTSNRNHIVRVQRSLQATYAGAIGAVLAAQGIAAPPLGIAAVPAADYGPPGALASLAAFDPANFAHPAVQAFAQNCLTCHLSAQPVAAPYFYRGTGCAACHTPYSAVGKYEGGDPTIPKDKPGYPTVHKLTVLMPYTQCAHCHGRGEYSAANVTFNPRDPASLTGQRATDYQPHRDPTAVLCERELDCIDCHNAAEAMGDGHIYPDIAAAPIVQCRTCHGTLTDPPSLVTLTDPNDPAFRRDALNANYSLQVGDTVVQAPNGEALGAVKWAEGRLVLTSRVAGTTYLVPPVKGSACQQEPDQQEAKYCRACHATP